MPLGTIPPREDREPGLDRAADLRRLVWHAPAASPRHALGGTALAGLAQLRGARALRGAGGADARAADHAGVGPAAQPRPRAGL
eukprot:3297407-Rhodomonas_salina.1